MAPNLKTLDKLTEQMRENQPPVFYAGAGLSYSLTPPEASISEHYLKIINNLNLPHHKEEELINAIQETVNESGNDDDKPYLIAQKILDFLENNLTLTAFSDIEKPKLRAKAAFAKAMGFFTDMSWHTPRPNIEPSYRVLARLLVEGASSDYWTTNWDCFLEQALQYTGLVEYPDFRHNTGWKSVYMRCLRAEDAHNISDDKVTIHKMHGCALDLRKAWQEYNGNQSSAPLEKAVSRLMVQKCELEKVEGRECGVEGGISETDKFFGDKFRTCIQQNPLFVITSKLYDRWITDQIKSNAVRPPDFLTILNPSWHDDYYDEIANCYGTCRAECHLETSRDSDWVANNVFLWLQAWYALSQIREYLLRDPNKQSYQDLADELAQFSTRLRDQQSPKIECSLLSFVDSFLPAWTRAVFRAGLLDYHFDPTELRSEEEDYYIPIKPLMQVLRLDHVAAIHILKQILEIMENFDFNAFRGGFWYEPGGVLYLPTPFRKNSEEPLKLDLQGYKPLRKIIRSHLAHIIAIKIVPVNLKEPLGEPNPELFPVLRREIIRILGLSLNAFGNITVIPLRSLNTDIITYF